MAIHIKHSTTMPDCGGTQHANMKNLAQKPVNNGGSNGLNYLKQPLITSMHRPTHGFSLLECLIALGIMAILTALSVPSYLRYTKRAYFMEIIQATAPHQFGVALCAQTSGSLSECNSGENGIPPAVNHQHHIAALTVRHGIINAVPEKEHGLSRQDNFTLTPTLDSNGLHWQRSGGAVQHGLIH
jgi:prepilin-type N-terminal cleavage/methylation domain-containing protein